jgi:hypothetical protein
MHLQQELRLATPKELRDARKSLENMPAINDDADYYEPRERGASSMPLSDQTTATTPRADEKVSDQDDPPIDLTMP